METPTIPLATAPSSGSSGGFSPGAQAELRRRLAAAAFVYAGCYTLAFGLDALLSPGAFATSAGEYVRSGLSIAMALGVGGLAGTYRLGARALARVAGGFQILGGLGISSGAWGWEGRTTAFLELLGERGLDLARVSAERFPLFSLDGVPWLGIWILIFPLIVPLSPGRALLASVLTAGTFHAVALASQWVHGVPPLVGPWVQTLYLSHTIPLAISVAVGWYGARNIYRLRRDLSRAQEMGSYRLVEKIGSGGMGEVWKAQHRMLARPAAIKLIRVDALGPARDSEAAQAVTARFEREAQATAGLASPHTVELYDFGVTDDGAFYYVMELLDGVDLKTLVETHGPVPPSRAVHLLEQACHSLEDAHRAGLVHRDIKPANLLVCRRGQDFDFVKVLDFGLVKDVAHGERAQTQLTRENTAAGTPSFMAPEVITGDREIDGRADLYALGCVAYWLLTGRLVFEGDTPMAILVQHARETPVPPSARTEMEVPAVLEEIVLECLRKDPADRPPSARVLRAALLSARAEVGDWTAERAERWWRLHLPEKCGPKAPRG